MPASRCGPEAFCDQVSREVVYAAILDWNPVNSSTLIIGDGSAMMMVPKN
jgi:hypothetical protein